MLVTAALLVVPAGASAQTEVPRSWPLIPSGLSDGDSFRLIFVTSTSRNATAFNIGVYNTFVQEQAAAGHSAIKAYSSQFRVVGSTRAVDARDNTGTTGTGVPIYWLNGSKVADHYADFYNGNWDDEANPRNQRGRLITTFVRLFTGSDNDGTEYVNPGGSSAALGSGSVRLGRINSTLSTANPLNSEENEGSTISLPFYGLSPVFTVKPAPAITDVSVTSRPADGTDTFKAGERVEVTFAFDEAVEVQNTGSNGANVSIRISMGDTNTYVTWSTNFLRMDHPRKLVFGLTVNSSHEDVDGLCISASCGADTIRLSGGGAIVAAEDGAAASRNYDAVQTSWKVDGDTEGLTGGVCDRQPAVRDAIVAKVSAASTCAAVTDAQVNAIGSLNLSGKGIGALRKSDFQGLTGLTELNLSGNALDHLPGDLFEHLDASLRTLKLNGNPLGALPAGVFDGLTGIRTLDLADTGLTELPAGLFADLDSLQELRLVENRLRAFPSAALADVAVTLQRLFMRDNDIASIAAGALDGMTQLRRLELQGNALTSLPAGLFDDLTELRELKLNDNSITTLPDNLLRPLTKVEVVSLEDNPGFDSFAPVVEAIPAQNVERRARVDLEAVPGASPWGDNVIWSWQQTDSSGTTVTLNEAETATPSFDAPVPNAETELAFEVTATGRGSSGANASEGTATALVTAPGRPRITDVSVTSRPRDGTDIFKRGENIEITATFSEPVRLNNASSVRNAIFPIYIRGGGGAQDFNNIQFARQDHPNRLIFRHVVEGGDSGVLGLGGSAASNITLNNQVSLVAVSDGTDARLGFRVQNTTWNVDGSTQTLTGGICAKGYHPAVLKAIVSTVQQGADCTEITATDLADALFRELDVSGKDIDSLHKRDFAGLTALRTLNLSGNDLDHLPSDLFDHVPTLTELKLNGNDIAALPANVFNRLTALTELELHGNDIAVLPANVFNPLPSLQALDLRANGLTALPPGVFDRLTELRRLRFSNNNLATLPDNVFEPLTKLISGGLWLPNNPGFGTFAPAVTVAEPAQTVTPGERVDLEATAGPSPWGANLQWSWTRTDTSDVTATLVDGNTRSAHFVAPAPVLETELGFQATATGRGTAGVSSPSRGTADAAVTVEDTTAPVLVSAEVPESGRSLALTFNEDLDITSVKLPPASAFTVTADGVEVAVQGVVAVHLLDNFSLRLPDDAIGQNQIVTVSYAVPATGTVIEDTAGNDALRFADRPVTNNSSVANTTAPVLVSAEVPESGRSLALTFNEDLDITNVKLPPASAFTVTADGVEVAVQGVVAVHLLDNFSLRLPDDAIGQNQIVTVSYAVPTTGTVIADTDGRPALAFDDEPVTNNSTVDGTPPVLASVEVPVSGDRLGLTFDEALDIGPAMLPPASAFTVKTDGVPVTVQSVTEGSGSNNFVLVLTAEEIKEGETVTVSYTVPTDGATVIEDTAGNDALPFTDEAVVNSSTVQVTPPRVTTARVLASGDQIVLTFNEDLGDGADKVPAIAFTVNVDDAVAPVQAVALGTAMDRLILSLPPRAILAGQTITVSYVVPRAGPIIKDTVRNAAESFTDQEVVNDSILNVDPPELASASVPASGETLTLTFNEDLDIGPTKLPPADAFTVKADGVDVAVQSVVEAGRMDRLTLNLLAEAIKADQTVTVSYTVPTGGSTVIEDADGYRTLSFTGQEVVNNSTVDGTPPELASAEVTGAGAVLTLTFNEDLDNGAGKLPVESAFIVEADGAPVDVESVAIGIGTDELILNLPAKAIHDSQTVTVSYAVPATGTVIADIAGNSAESFTDRGVVNSSTLNLAEPVLAVLAASGGNIIITFDDDIHRPGSTFLYPTASAFTVRADGVRVTVNNVTTSSSSSSDIKMFLSGAKIGQGQVVTVSYAVPTGNGVPAVPLKDADNENALPFTDYPVTNNSTVDNTTPPFLVRGEVLSSGGRLELTFNKALETTGGHEFPPISAFTIEADSVVVAVTTARIVLGHPSNLPDLLLLSLSDTIAEGQTVTLSYAVPEDEDNPLQDVDGNKTKAFTDREVVNNSTVDVTPPELVSAAVPISGDSLTLTYDDDLDTRAGKLPAADAFTIKVDTITITVQSMAGGAGTNDLVLNLPTPIGMDQVVTVSYTVPASTPNRGIQDTDGNKAASFTDISVPNHSEVEGSLWETTFEADTASEDVGTVTLTVSPGAGVAFGEAVTIRLAYGGAATRGGSDDFTAPTSLTLPAGDSSVSATVTIRDDPQVEGDETIVATATLTDGTAAGTATLTIMDDDAYGLRVRANRASVAEGESETVTLTLTLLDSAGNPATAGRCIVPFEIYSAVGVSGTAASPADYTVTGDLTQIRFAACQVSKTETVTVLAKANDVQETAVKTVVFTPRVTIAPLGPDTALHMPATLEIRDATPTPVPELLGAVAPVSGDRVILTFDDDLDIGPDKLPSADAFMVKADGVEVTVQSVGEGSGADNFILNLRAGTIKTGQTVTVSYAVPPTNAIRDLAGTEALPFTDRTVVNNSNVLVSPPELTGGEVAASGDVLTLTFNEELDNGPDRLPPANAFTVKADGAVVAVLSVAVGTGLDQLILNLPAAAIGEGRIVTVSYVVPATNAIRDVEGNDALPFTDRPVVNNSTVDVTPPELASAEVGGSGNWLTLTFNEDLDIGETKLPSASAFTIKADGVVVIVQRLNVAADIDQLNLVLPAAAIGLGQIVTVSYAVPDTGTVIEDTEGNEAAAFDDFPVVNNSTVDLTPPVLASAEVGGSGNWLTLTFNEDLDIGETKLPSASAFTVKADGVVVIVQRLNVAADIDQLNLILPAAAIGRDQIVTVSYAVPTSGTVIEDTNDNDALPFTDRPVVNNSTVENNTPPVLASAEVGGSGNWLTLTFNEDLDIGETKLPPASAFTVKADGVVVIVQRLNVAADIDQLNLILPTAEIKAGQTVTVSYAVPTTGTVIEDTVGNDALPFTDAPVTNNSTVDVTPPELASAEVLAVGGILTLTFNEDLDIGETKLPPASAFTVKADGAVVIVQRLNVAVDIDQLNLVLPAAAIKESQTVTVSYAVPATGTVIEDTAGNDALPFTDEPVVNNSTVDVTLPKLAGAVVLVSGDRLILTYDDDLDLRPGRLPPAGAFTVKANGVKVDVQSVVVGAGTDDFILNLPAGAITESQTVTVSYSVPTTGTVIADTDGNDAVSFTDRPVVNNSEVQPNTAPVFDEDMVTFEIAENQPVGTDIGDPVTATDEEGDDLEYSLADTPYAGNFSIDAATGQLHSDSLLDFEGATVGRPNMLAILVVADDGRGGTAQITVVVSVTDVDEPPDAPVAVTVTGSGTTSLEVTWTAPSNAGRPDIEHYDVQYREVANQWMDGPQDQTGTNATIMSVDAGKSYEVRVRATNDEGDGPWAAWDADNSPATGKPMISGTPQVGQTLTADTSDIVDADGLPSSFTYVWVSVDASDVETLVGANSNTYSPDSSHVGSTIVVRVSFTDGAGFSETVTSVAVGPVVAAPNTAGVTVSKTALTVAEEDTTGNSYTVVLDTQPTASVTVTVAGHASTVVSANPASLTFTTSDWNVAQRVTVTAGNDADTTDDTVTLTHSATSTDSEYSGIAIGEVAVTVNDNDTAQVTGVSVTPGNARLAVNWMRVDHATGYKVQWKSGNQGYNRGNRQATVTPGSTTSYTIPGLVNGAAYTVQVIATRTGADDGPPSAEATGTPAVPNTAGVTVSKTALTVAEEDTTGGSYTVVLDTQPTASVTVTVGGHSGTGVTPNPATLTFTPSNWNVAQRVTVTASDDADTTDDTVLLTHSATSADGDYNGIGIAEVTVTVNDNDTAQVTGVSVTPGNAQLAVSWTQVDHATGYKVQWKSGSQGYNNTGNRQATVTPGSTTSHTIQDLTNDTAYTVQVIATRTGANDGPPSAEMTGTPALAVPGAPALEVAAGNETATLRWTPPNDDGGAPVTGYEYTRDGGTTHAAAGGGDARTYTVRGLENGTEYTFEVRAVNRIGAGAWSAAKTVTPVPLTLTVEAVNETVTEGDPVVYRIVMSNRTAGVLVGEAYRYKGKFLSTETVSTVTGIRSRRGVLYWEVERATVDDAVAEANGKFTVRLQPGDGYTLGTSSSVTVTIVDNDGGESPAAPGVTVSKTTLTVAEEDPTGDSYTVVLDIQPTGDVTMTVAGHAGTDVTPDPATLLFTPSNWDTARTVTVTAGDDADTTNDTVTLTHNATSTDSEYSGIAIGEVAVTVNDNDTAQVTGVTVTPGNTQLAVSWTRVDHATGYKVQWKSGSESYNTGDRQAAVTPGSTTSHTIQGLTNGAAYTLQVIATRTNDGPPSAEMTGTPAAPTTAGVTVSKPALTVAEEDPTGDSYTVVLDIQPTADVTVTVAGHAGTDVTPDPATLTFTPSNWDTPRMVTVTAADDADTTDDTVTLTHSATSTDTDYNGIVIAEVTVTVTDNDTAQVTGVSVAPGNAQLAVNWTAVDNATGYKVQWKSGSEGYNTGDRQAAVTSGSTTNHTIPNLNNGAEYTVQVIATRTGAHDGPPSAEMTGTPAAPTTAGVTVSKPALTVAEEDPTGNSYTVVLDIQPTADVTVTVAGHTGTDVTPDPATLLFTPSNWDTARTVTVTAADDTDTTDDTVTLTHSAASTDGDYSGIGIAEVTVTVNDDDTAPGPVVTGAHLVSASGPGGVWSEGDTVEAVVRFSEAVTVDTSGGAPALAIVLGGQRREAVYVRGSGTAALVFHYVVIAADDGALTARVVAGGLSLNGATIRNAAGVDAELGFVLAPAVTSVAVAPDPDGDGTWSPGEAVTVTVGFSDEVTVDTSGGTPSVAVLAEGGEREALYVTGSGTAGLRFAYTVTADDGVVTSVQVPANGLALNGGAIVGPTGLAAALAHPEASRMGTPAAPALSVADASAAEGGTLVFAVTLDRAAAAVLTVDWATGDGTAQAGEDYDAASGTLVFATGETARTVHVAVLEDNEVEGAETMELTLSNATGAGLADATATGTVSDLTGAQPEISVADDKVREGPDVELAFAVTLDRASQETVTVDWETLDGGGKAGAKAGQDYVAASGTLAFAPGETAKTVHVAVLDDAHDEGREVMLLILTNAVGATIADAVAKGTIENSDHMPKAWLSRFGRTVAEQVLDAVEDRLRAAPRAGVEARLAGEALPLWDGGSRSGGRDRLSSGEDAGDAAALAKVESARSQAELAALTDWLRDDPGPWSGADSGDGRRDTLQSRAVTSRDFLTGTSFAMTEEAAGGAGLVSLWGRGALTRFDGRESGPNGDLTLEGEVGSAMLGADWTGGAGFRSDSGAGAWTAGLLLAHSRGEGSYRGEVDGNGDTGGTEGAVLSSVTGLYPYGRYRVTNRVTLWGVAGYGAGTLTLTPQDADGKVVAPLRTDMELMMAALGVRGVAIEASSDGGFELAGTSDAMVVRTSSEKTSGLMAATGDVTRLRLGLEGVWRGLAFGGHELEPSLEVGIRHDGGDAETGFGVDIGAGLSWSHANSGVSAEVSARGLLTHAADGFRDQGIAGSLTWDPRPETDRGALLTLRQTMGAQATGGMDALLGHTTLAGLAANDDDDELQNRRLELKLGYGFPVFSDRFTSTPEIELGFSDRARDYSLGWRLTLARRDAGTLELGVVATRREHANDEPRHVIGFQLTARW